MLLYDVGAICKSVLLLMLLIAACTGYAYLVNARRTADDPKKKDYPFGAIFLAPFTWPLFILGSISIFVIKAVSYAIFLILFTIALVAVRKPFLLIWLDKVATWVGERLLDANTFLVRAAFGNRAGP
jgi:hypothetical protein